MAEAVATSRSEAAERRVENCMVAVVLFSGDLEDCFLSSID